MHVDLMFLLLMYIFSVSALAVSIYVLWSLKEFEQMFRTKDKKKAKPPLPPITVSRSKGHWD
jgi:flagellar basal body-associated protein FliL